MPYVKKPVGRVRVQHDWDGSDAMGAARRRMILGGIGLAAGLMASYPAMFRSRCLTWGATPEEIARRLPGSPLPQQSSRRLP
jgi:hypothetical protein